MKATLPLKIVVLQRSWVVVGRWARDGDMATLSDAAVVRRWGTTAGLGELAAKGPLKNTVLDACPLDVTVPLSAVVMLYDCDGDKWLKKK